MVSPTAMTPRMKQYAVCYFARHNTPLDLVGVCHFESLTANGNKASVLSVWLYVNFLTVTRLIHR